MNSTEVVLYLSCLIHVLIWLVVVFGGLLSYEIVLLNLYVFLPLIFVLQSVLSSHIIVRFKLEYIWNHKEQLNSNSGYTFTKHDYQDIMQYNERMNLPKEQIEYSVRVLKYYEHQCVLPKVLDNLKMMFANSFRNPFDAQALIVIGLLVNLVILASYKKL